MLLDIVILPPAKLRKKIGRAVVKSVKGTPTIFAVDNKKLIPHMSLFHLNMDGRRMPRLEKIIYEIAKRHRPFVVRYENTDEEHGHIILGLSKPKAAVELNRDVVKNTHHLRSGAMPWASKRKAKQRERENRKKFGTHLNIGNSFRPHLTLVKFTNTGDVTEVKKRLPKLDFSFAAEAVAIAEVNYWHQVTRVIKKFRMKT